MLLPTVAKFTPKYLSLSWYYFLKIGFQEEQKLSALKIKKKGIRQRVKILYAAVL
jgi:hypothetical protein